jgi:starch phosphorylase
MAPPVLVSTPIDPVCGMKLEQPSVTLDYDGRVLAFCSEFCKQQFQRHPRAYDEQRARPVAVDGWASREVAYFSMEIALDNAIQTYSGGLGVLAGENLASCADLRVPVVAVTLAHRKGYFRQEIVDGAQVERDATWSPEQYAHPLDQRVRVEVEGRPLLIRGWRYDLVGSSYHVVPVVLLDTDLPENTEEHRRISDHLYGGDPRYRLMQEVVLGVGGMRMLLALGCARLQTFHLNEGHAALAPVELLRVQAELTGSWDTARVRRKTVFTTHTPVAAGHDQFDWGLALQVLGSSVPTSVLESLAGKDRLNMTRLALNLSHFVNGVALRHREVSSRMFPDVEIHQITNGVHSRSWTSDSFRALFDRYIPGWRGDPLMLHNAVALPAASVWAAHVAAKQVLLAEVEARSGVRLNADALTIGFARRMTAYKRPELILTDLQRLRSIARARPLQLLFAGKAHPRDEAGKRAISAIFEAARTLGVDLPLVFLPGYDLELALKLVSGCDLWLNTPLRPFEASGTSGMKAAHNGVPSFSVLDGWWAEGHVEGVTGWSIGGADPEESAEDGHADADDLYRKLEQLILPRFYDDRPGWTGMMRYSIGLNAAAFNTHRMVHQYLLHAYAQSLASKIADVLSAELSALST